MLREMRFKDGRALMSNGHLLWKAENAENKRRLKAYKELGIKKVVRENGKTEWYGCSKKSQRCFGTVSLNLKYSKYVNLSIKISLK